MSALIEGYDAALFDLDGVVYLGPVAVPGAAEGIAALRARDVRVGFVTNNANRPPQVVADHLRQLDVPADPSDVVTSAQAGAQLVLARFGAGATVLAVGGPGVWEALAEVGLTAVADGEQKPVAVLQGWGEGLTWNDLNEAAIAIQRGAHWVATNTDPTRPTDRGLVPGNGAAVAAVQVAVSTPPEVAGKPFRPLLEETVARLGAGRSIFVGDRLDTDIAGAVNAGLDSLLVLTGSHGVADLFDAEPGSRPTHLGFDLRALLDPARVAHVRGHGSDLEVACGDQLVRLETDTVRFAAAPPDSRSAAVDAGWATAQLVWAAADHGTTVDTDDVVDHLVPLLRVDPVG